MMLLKNPVGESCRLSNEKKDEEKATYRFPSRNKKWNWYGADFIKTPSGCVKVFE